MLELTNFAISKKLYAIKRDTFVATYSGDTQKGEPMYRVSVDAMWFRRKQGIEVISKGKLGDLAVGKEWDIDDFIANVSTARYGGTPFGSWDGYDVIGVTNYEAIVALVKELDPILDAYPDVPVGYEGWYKIVDNLR